jgi:chromosomal replication initiation ATPase DnaA|tara:strand:+ start:3921 stop:4214 length:294 start_codon:yes stop_codon:yes gene_type:complete
MKERIFNLYAKKVGQLFNITPEEMFKKSKARECVDARHLLYYMCSQRPMRITYIQKYMKENGYDINHSSIIHGINVMKEKISEDSDYIEVINSFENV